MINKIVFKKISVIILCIVVLLSTVSCSDNNGEKDKISIVCTAFSQYDFVKQIVGEKEDLFDITYLFENGADVHSFENDVGFNVKIKIMNSDVFIYNGGESDSWVNNVLNDKGMNKDCKTISLLEIVGFDSLIESNLSEAHNHEHSEECADKYDEHVWLSLKNADKICKRICELISSFDLENKKHYEDNSEKYCNKILTLHNEAIEFFSEFQNPFVVVADRFPFSYLFSDYGIEYSAAFSGCSSEVTATYENIIKLCRDVENRQLIYIIVLEKSNSNISSSVISTSKQKVEVLTVNSLQAISKNEIENGLTYLDVMNQNIEVLKKAVSNK